MKSIVNLWSKAAFALLLLAVCSLCASNTSAQGLVEKYTAEKISVKFATLTATKPDGAQVRFDVRVLLLTPKEVEYFRNGGILHYVLRQLASRKA